MSAGEVEQFVYCPQNWWLARHGVDGDGAASRRGAAGHDAAGRAQQEMSQARREHRQGLRWSFRILALAASATGLTLAVLYLELLPLPWLFVTLALVLTAASTGLLVIALDAQKQERLIAQRTGVPPGTVLDSDLDGAGNLLHDPEWDLHGVPDSIIAGANGPVPVEVKTSVTPERPHDNHRLQLAAYLRLMEANGQTPSHGLLTYPEGVFPLQWTDELRAELRFVLDQIRHAERTGQADRNHGQIGRCIGCARRDGCQQALGTTN